MSLPSVNPDQHTFRSPKFKSVVKEAVEFLTKTPVHFLPPATDFAGVGVYALYYLGSVAYYSHIAHQNQQDCRQPIYIGKAVPGLADSPNRSHGPRQSALSTPTGTRPLYRR